MDITQTLQNKPFRAGFRARINENCKQCLYDPTQAGTWRKQVENCPCFECPLYEVRPKAISSETLKEDQPC